MRSIFLTPERYDDLKGRYAKFNEPWTPDELDELRSMAADGVPRAEMSEQLGRTPNAIKMKLQSLGLYVPKPAAKPWTDLDDDALVKLYREGASSPPSPPPSPAPKTPSSPASSASAPASCRTGRRRHPSEKQSPALGSVGTWEQVSEAEAGECREVLQASFRRGK